MGMINSAGWVMFSAVLLGGCVHFAPKPITPIETVNRFEQRTLDDPGLHTFLLKSMPGDTTDSWPMSAWDVDSLALAALYFRPDMDLVRARWAAARAATVTAGQFPNPALGIAPQYNMSSSKKSPWLAPVVLDVPIETAGKRPARQRHADLLVRSAWWKIASTAWRLRHEVQQSLLALQAAKESMQLIQEQLHVQQELVDRMQALLEAGEISSFDLAQSQITLQTLQLTRFDIARKKKDAETQLATALGVPSVTTESVEFRLIPLGQVLPGISIPEARLQALIHRADILSALADYEAAQEMLQLEIARQYPDFSLGPGYEFDQDDNKWGLGFSITLPVLNHNQGQIAEAEARRIEAGAKFDVLQTRVIGEIDSAVAAFQSQTETVTAAEGLFSISSQQEEKIRARKEAGELSRLDELNARATLLKAKQDLLQTRVRQRRNYYTLENALQSPEILPESFTNSPTDTTAPGPDNS